MMMNDTPYDIEMSWILLHDMILYELMIWYGMYLYVYIYILCVVSYYIYIQAIERKYNTEFTHMTKGHRR